MRSPKTISKATLLLITGRMIKFVSSEASRQRCILAFNNLDFLPSSVFQHMLGQVPQENYLNLGENKHLLAGMSSKIHVARRSFQRQKKI